MNYIDRLAQGIRGEVRPEDLPEGDLGELFRLYALLVRVKGVDTTAADVHDAWAVWMSGQDAEHESIRPFEELDRPTRAEDVPYLRAVLAIAARYDSKAT